ncbi:hypothetical protein [Bacillus paramycoides]|nr:hypothetical protein [Bacillus paramycoides]MED0958523.1 hypothetical protein [Bacillus paramycoides]MED0972361.1 hypothetical protein [Bacillus paramycoides]MED0981901.1 hypothetical protein [Bacillus paramycoides]MED1092639.1 hypothetical protein [Bacillus paramycoides]
MYRIDQPLFLPHTKLKQSEGMVAIAFCIFQGSELCAEKYK